MSAAAPLSFEEAVRKAKAEKLTDFHKVGEGVPFYSVKTLDPRWHENGEVPVVKVTNVEFLDQNGKKQTEKVFEGKISIVAFFFSSCAGFCPTLIKNLQNVEAKVKLRYKNVQYVGVTVDPGTDTSARLKDYAKKMRLDPSWILLTGSEPMVSFLAQDTFAAEIFKLPKSKGQVSHSEHLYVLDNQGRLRGVLKGTRKDAPEKANEIIAALLSESSR